MVSVKKTVVQTYLFESINSGNGIMRNVRASNCALLFASIIQMLMMENAKL